MSIHAATVAPRLVLADFIPSKKIGTITRDTALVASGAALTGASAQIAIAIPAISPVPFVLTTLTVALLGAALGPVRAVAAMALYLTAGLAGMPWFTDGSSGASANFGYIIGFVVAGGLVGWLARRGGDRTVLRTAGLMVLGSLAIYAVGVPYLILATGMSLTDGLVNGAAVFIVFDLLKVVIAAALLPGAWRLIGKIRE